VKEDHRSVASETDAARELPMPRRGVRGRVLLPDGSPAKGAVVAMTDSAGAPDIASRTDHEGRFHLPGNATAGNVLSASLEELAGEAVIGADGAIEINLSHRGDR